jgi:dTDP-4-dehydrorhamnose reductase
VKQGAILVYGANGLVGSHVVRALRARSWSLHPVLGRAECDICDPTAVTTLVERLRPTVVVNAAGYTDVDRAEDERHAAFAANAEGAENVARAAAEVGAYLIHVSTDFAFGDGRPGARCEDESVSPIGVYAESKVAGEVRVRAGHPRAAIVRIGNVYGTGGRNFAARLHSLLVEGRHLRLDAERVLSPTPAWAIARQLVVLMEPAPVGTFHATCEGATTWYQFALTLAAELAIERPSVEAVESARLPYRTPRASVVLERRALGRLGLDVMPSWQVGLREYLDSEGGLARQAPRQAP